MKQLINFSPLFTPGPANQGTLDFTAYPNFNIDRLYAVINVTRNAAMYIPGATGLGLYSVTNQPGYNWNPSILTLSLDTSTYHTSDQLLVFYDTAPGRESNNPQESGGQLQNIAESNRQILIELKVQSYILAQGLNINKDDMDAWRQDVTNGLNNSSESI